MAATLVQRAAWLGKFLSPSPRLFQYHREVRRSGHFDRAFYLGVNASLHPLFRAFPERHFVVFGEREGLQPNPEFSSRAYLRQNTDLTAWAERPYQHFLRHGRFENRPTRELPAGANTGKQVAPVVRARGDAASRGLVVGNAVMGQLVRLGHMRFVLLPRWHRGAAKGSLDSRIGGHIGVLGSI
ncbi:hypothetical protein GALL_400830 [mine drainage metagenome]|uniref:Uncharacterized protein n=1 Tax=mine drainage metagenome TaxID=410659 RepID=A0A1J5Q4K1_9ZZZZ